MSKIELPPPPAAHKLLGQVSERCTFGADGLKVLDAVDQRYPVFTASQLRARDRQIVELCAALCDALSDEVELIPPSNKLARGRMQGMWDCAAAIRSLLDPASPSSLPAEQQESRNA